MYQKPYKDRSELLFKNVVDSNIIGFFRPLNLIHTIFCMSKYTIRGNFITYRSSGSIAISFLSVILVIIIYSLRVIMYNSGTMTSLFVYINTIIDSVYYSLGFMLNFYSCVIYKDLNINIVLKIQEIYKYKIITRNILSKLTRSNWIYICICLFFYIYYFFSLVYLLKDYMHLIGFFLIHICQTFLFAFDINTIYATQIIRILTAALREWLFDVKSTTTVTNTPLLKGGRMKRHVPTNEWQDAEAVTRQSDCNAMQPHAVDVLHANNIQTPNQAKPNGYWNGKLTTYATILEAYETTKTVFQLMILYHCVETFIHAVFYVYYTTHFLQVFKTDADNLGSYSAGLTVLWILKNILIVTLLNVEFEHFYMAASDVMINSLLQLANNCSEKEKQMHKNVVRMSRLSPKFEVCNLFSLGAAMPRRLLSLIATYTIVVLQFKLL